MKKVRTALFLTENDSIEPILARSNGLIKVVKRHGSWRGWSIFEIENTEEMSYRIFYSIIYAANYSERMDWFLPDVDIVVTFLPDGLYYSEPIRMKDSAGEEIDMFGPLIFLKLRPRKTKFGTEYWPVNINMDEILAILT